MTPRRLLHRLRFWRGWGRELSAEIDRRLRPLEEAGEKQVIIDIWVLRQLLNRPPGIPAAERPTKLTKEASDELTTEAKDELAVLREKAKGRRPRKEEIDPIIGIEPLCCARVASGHAAAAPPSSVMNVRRFMSDIGLPLALGPDDRYAPSAYLTKARKVLGSDLNRCESVEAPTASPMKR
jgi:hypothetical protein